jgi:Tol biopolymer transport system component
VANDTNGLRDVFVRDLLTGTNFLVSVATNSMSGNGASTDSAISADGRYVAFTSSATNLVANDNNNVQDVFLRDLQNGTNLLVSMSTDNIHPGNGPSYSPTISSGGRYVLFHSKALNLASNLTGGPPGIDNLFWRDTQSGTTYALTASSLQNGVLAAMSADGRKVAFFGAIWAGSANLYVWDSQFVMRIYTNIISGIFNVAISPDGNRLVYSAGNPVQLQAVDLAANTNWVINSQASQTSHPGLRFSSDGRFLAYVALVSNSNQIYLYDFQAGTNFLISRSFNSSNAANGPSDSPDISADGRFVVYRSAAADIISGVSNGVPNIFLYDRLADANLLMSVSQYGNGTADNRSLSPVFSGDGQTLFLQSWASDITANDFNHSGDIFSFKLYSTAWIVSSAISSGQPLKIIWTVAPGYTYRVQYKDNLTDPVWLELNGTTTVVSDNEYVTDLASNPNQRFYRIIGN